MRNKKLFIDLKYVFSVCSHPAWHIEKMDAECGRTIFSQTTDFLDRTGTNHLRAVIFEKVYVLWCLARWWPQRLAMASCSQAVDNFYGRPTFQSELNSHHYYGAFFIEERCLLLHSSKAFSWYWSAGICFLLAWIKNLLAHKAKKDILFLRQFLFQKKGLKLRENIIFSAVWQIFYNIPTWLKLHITTEHQVSKVHCTRYLYTFYLYSFEKRVLSLPSSKKSQVGILSVLLDNDRWCYEKVISKCKQCR